MLKVNNPAEAERRSNTRSQHLVSGCLLLLALILIHPFPLLSEETQAGVDKKIKQLSEIAETQKDAEAYNQLGWLYLLDKSDVTNARTCFEQVLAQDPRHLAALDGLMLTYYARGHLKKVVQTMLKIIKQHPDSPEAEFYLRNIQAYLGSILAQIMPFKERFKFFNDLVQTPLQNKIAENFIRANCLIPYYSYQDENETAFELWKKLGYIDKWSVIGYWGPQGVSCFDDVLPPEKGINLKRKYKIEGWEVKWHKVILKGIGYNKLYEDLKNQGSCVFLSTYIKSPLARPIALRISSSNETSYKIWLNNKLIVVSDAFKEYLPRSRFFGTALNQGWNQILIKSVSQYGGRDISIRITDPEGAPFNDLVYEVEFEKEPPAIAPFELLPEKIKVNRGCFDYYHKRINSPDAKGTDYDSLAMLYEIDGLTQKAFQMYESAYKLHPKSAYPNQCMGMAYMQNKFYPEEKRMDLARSYFEKAVQLDPAYVPALLSLAGYYQSKNKDKAIKYLKKVLAVNPDCFEAHSQLYEIFDERGWEAEKIAGLKTMEKLAPDTPKVLALWAHYYGQQNNLDKAREYYLQIQKLQGYKTYWPLMNLSERKGDYKPLIKYCLSRTEKSPDPRWFYYRLIKIYEKLQEYDKAEEMYLKLLELKPDNYPFYREIARFYYRTGQPQKAREYWDKLQALPSKYRLYDTNRREFLELIREESDQAIASYEITPEEIQEIIKNAPGAEEYPDVSTLLLLQERIVRIKGEKKDYKEKETSIHKVIKILNKKGGEQYGQISLPGRIYEARLFTPDGKVLEPDPVSEGYSIRFPELDAGSIIELKYQELSGYGVTTEVQDIDCSPFFRNNEQPILLLRYVVIIPKKATYVLRKRHNLPEPEIKQTGNETVYIWEVKDCPDYEAERLTPSINEVIAHAEFFVGKPSTEKTLRYYRSQHMDSRIPDNVKVKTKELIRGIESRRDKIKALYKFAVTEIKDGATKNSSQTLIEKKGDVARLFRDLVRTADIEVYEALARPKINLGFDWEKQKPHFYIPLLYIPMSDEEALWFSPRHYMPFGSFNETASGGEAFLASRGGGKIIEVPETPLEQGFARGIQAEIKLSEKGESAECNTKFILAGTGTAMFRQMMEHLNEETKKMMIEQLANELFTGTQLKSYKIPEFDIEKPVMELEIKCLAPKFITRTKKGRKCRPILTPLQRELSQRFLSRTKRKFPLRLQGYLVNSSATIDQIKLVLPAGINPDLVQVPNDTVLINEFGYYSLTYQKKTNSIIVERRFRLKEQDIPVEKYKHFVSFCKKIDTAERRKVVLPLAD